MTDAATDYETAIRVLSQQVHERNLEIARLRDELVRRMQEHMELERKYIGLLERVVAEQGKVMADVSRN